MNEAWLISLLSDIDLPERCYISLHVCCYAKPDKSEEVVFDLVLNRGIKSNVSLVKDSLESIFSRLPSNNDYLKPELAHKTKSTDTSHCSEIVYSEPLLEVRFRFWCYDVAKGERLKKEIGRRIFQKRKEVVASIAGQMMSKRPERAK